MTVIVKFPTDKSATLFEHDYWNYHTHDVEDKDGNMIIQLPYDFIFDEHILRSDGSMLGCSMSEGNFERLKRNYP